MFKDATRFRIPLRSLNGECGFITIASWAPDVDRQVPPRSTTQVFEQPARGKVKKDIIFFIEKNIRNWLLKMDCLAEHLSEFITKTRI